MAALSSGHLATDLAQGSLPALLPYLVDKFDLTYTLAAALVLAATISSSLIQPAFGLWSDARGALWLPPAGSRAAPPGPPRLLGSAPLRAPGGGRRRRLSPRRLEVRELRQRFQARERHV